MAFGAGGGLRPEPRPEPRGEPILRPDAEVAKAVDHHARAEKRPYRSPLGPARFLRIAAVGAAASGAAVIAYLQTAAEIVQRASRDPVSVFQEDLVSIDANSRRLAWAVLALQLVMSILLFVWVRRMYRNLTTLGANATAFTPGWAVGSWFVPFLNFVRPKQIVDEIWRASDPDLPEFHATPRSKVPRLLNVWWGFWVGSGIVAVVVRQSRTPESLGDIEDFLYLEMFAMTLAVVTSLLVERVAAHVTMRHHDRAVRMGVTSPLPRRWSTSLAGPDGALSGRSVAVAFGPTVVAVAFVGLAAVTLGATLRGDTGVTSSGSETRLIADLAVGECMDFPVGEYVLVVPIVPCDQPHDAEVLALLPLGDSLDAYPGVDVLFDRIMEGCLPAFDEYVGLVFEESVLDVQYLYPPEMAWQLGNTTAQCFIVSLDGSKLTGSMRGAAR